MKYYPFETTEYPISYYLAKEDYLLSKGEECFFVWNNAPAVIIGKNQVLETEVNVEYAKEHNIPIYRRKSGGGAVYSDSGCFMFTFIVEKDSVEDVFFNCLRKIRKVLIMGGVHAEFSSRNDLIIDEKKFSGNAVYIKGNYAVMHGSILYDTDFDVMTSVLTPASEKLESNGVESVRSRVTNLKEYTKLTKEQLMDVLQRSIGGAKGELFESETSVINKLQAKYEDPNWINGSSIPYTFTSTKRFEMGMVTFQARIVRKHIDQVKITGDFFEGSDVVYLESFFANAPFKKGELAKIIKKANVSKYLAGISAEEFETLFEGVEE